MIRIESVEMLIRWIGRAERLFNQTMKMAKGIDETSTRSSSGPANYFTWTDASDGRNNLLSSGR